MNKYLLIYHKEDNDGIISGALINKWLKFTYKEDANITLCPSTYSELSELWESGEVANFWHNEYDYVIMTDLSFNEIKAMKYLKNTFKNHFIWIDHHAPAIQASIKEGYSGLEGYRDTNQSAILNAYRYFYDPLNIAREDGTLPNVLRVLSAYDSFSYEREGYTLDYVEAVNLGANSTYELDFDKCTQMLNIILYYDYAEYIWKASIHNDCILENLENCGKTIQQYERQKNKKIIADYGDGGWLIENTNRKCIVLFIQGQTSSIMFDSVKHLYSNAAVFKRTPKGDWVMSLYNTNKNDNFHCGEYLKEKYNGGGHQGASGCTLSENKFLKMLKTKTI